MLRNTDAGAIFRNQSVQRDQIEKKGMIRCQKSSIHPKFKIFWTAVREGLFISNRPEQFDIVILPAEFYAAMLYHIQTVEEMTPEQMRADPLLKPVFDRIAKNKAIQPDPE